MTRLEHIGPTLLGEKQWPALTYRWEATANSNRGAWQLDTRLICRRIRQEKGKAAVAHITVDMSAGGVMQRSSILTIPEVNATYNQPLQIAVQWQGLDSMPEATRDDVGWPFWMFVGSSDSIEMGWDVNHLGAEILAYGKMEMADVVDRPIHGRYMQNPPNTSWGSAADWTVEVARVTSLPCTFNYKGKPNRGPNTQDLAPVNMFDPGSSALPSTIKIPLFVKDDEFGAKYWTYLQAIQYIKQYHLPGAAIDFDAPWYDLRANPPAYKWFTNGQITTDPLSTGKITDTTNSNQTGGEYDQTDKFIQRLQMQVHPAAGVLEGMGPISGLRHLLGAAGLSVHEEIRGFNEEQPVSRLVIWCPDSRSTHWIPSFWTDVDNSSTKLSGSEVRYLNQIQGTRLFFDRARTPNKCLGIGGPLEFEVTVPMIPGWDKNDDWFDTIVSGTDHPGTQLAAADTAINSTLKQAKDDPTLWTSDAWLSKYHPLGTSYEANNEVGRFWILNENGQKEPDTSETDNYEKYVFGKKGEKLIDGVTPVPSWEVTGEFTKENTTGATNTVTNDDGDGWNWAKPGDHISFNEGNWLKIEKVEGDVITHDGTTTGSNVETYFRPADFKPFVCVRSRRFLPTTTADNQNNPLAPFIEVSFDYDKKDSEFDPNTATWEPASAVGLQVKNHNNSCAISFTNRNKSMREIYSEKVKWTDTAVAARMALVGSSGYTAPSDSEFINFFAAYVLQLLAIRVTANVETDIGVHGETLVAEAPSGVTGSRWASVVGINEFRARNREAGNSRFESAITTTRERDDHGRLQSRTQRYLQERAVNNLANSIVIPWIDLRFRVGESVAGIQGLGGEYLGGQGISFEMTKPGGVKRLPAIIAIDWNFDEADTTIQIEDLRLDGDF